MIKQQNSSCKWRVGFWVTEKKAKKLKFEKLRHICLRHNIDLIRLNVSALDTVGRLDGIVHKFSDLIISASAGQPEACAKWDAIQRYVKAHPDLLMLDPIDSVSSLLDRTDQYALIERVFCDFDGGIVPKFAEITSSDLQKNIDTVANAGLRYPLVCKPKVAHGSFAHKMALVFCPGGLADVQLPFVAQTFIPHGGTLYKVFVMGPHHYIVDRPSLKDFQPGDFSTIFFDSGQVSKEGCSSELTDVTSSDPCLMSCYSSPALATQQVIPQGELQVGKYQENGASPTIQTSSPVDLRTGELSQISDFEITNVSALNSNCGDAVEFRTNPPALAREKRTSILDKSQSSPALQIGKQTLITNRTVNREAMASYDQKSKTDAKFAGPGNARQPVNFPDPQRIERMVRAIQAQSRLSLFGLDVIVDRDTQKYHVIDVNFFPSYDGVPKFYFMFADYLRIQMSGNAKQRQQQHMTGGAAGCSAANRSFRMRRGRTEKPPLLGPPFWMDPMVFGCSPMRDPASQFALSLSDSKPPSAPPGNQPSSGLPVVIRRRHSSYRHTHHHQHCGLFGNQSHAPASSVQFGAGTHARGHQLTEYTETSAQEPESDACGLQSQSAIPVNFTLGGDFEISERSEMSRSLDLSVESQTNYLTEDESEIECLTPVESASSLPIPSQQHVNGIEEKKSAENSVLRAPSSNDSLESSDKHIALVNSVDKSSLLVDTGFSTTSANTPSDPAPVSSASSHKHRALLRVKKSSELSSSAGESGYSTGSDSNSDASCFRPIGAASRLGAGSNAAGANGTCCGAALSASGSGSKHRQATPLLNHHHTQHNSCSVVSSHTTVATAGLSSSPRHFLVARVGGSAGKLGEANPDSTSRNHEGGVGGENEEDTYPSTDALTPVPRRNPFPPGYANATRTLPSLSGAKRYYGIPKRSKSFWLLHQQQNSYQAQASSLPPSSLQEDVSPSNQK